MNGEPEQGPVLRLGDLDVVIAPGVAGSGTAARIVVTDSRNRRTLVRLHPREAYAFGVVLTSKAKAAGVPPTDHPSGPDGPVTEPDGG